MNHKIVFLALSAMLFALCSSAEAQEGKKIPWVGYLAGSARRPIKHSCKGCVIWATSRARTWLLSIGLWRVDESDTRISPPNWSA